MRPTRRNWNELEFMARGVIHGFAFIATVGSSREPAFNLLLASSWSKIERAVVGAYFGWFTDIVPGARTTLGYPFFTRGILIHVKDVEPLTDMIDNLYAELGLGEGAE